MQVNQAAFVDKTQRIFGHLVSFGRETGNDIGAKRHIGSQRADFFAEIHYVLTQMASLHALKHHVITRLQADMHMGHQTRFSFDQTKQIFVNLDRINR